MTCESIFESVFLDTKGTSKAYARISMPVSRQAWVPEAKEFAKVWRCDLVININGEHNSYIIDGETSLQAISIAGERAEVLLSASGDGWETCDGLPIWIVFPKQVPIAWGEAFYFDCVGYIQKKEDVLGSNVKRKFE